MAAEAIAAYVELALAAVHREYPSHLLHLLRSDADALPPRRLHPAFYGSFDWHSAVHAHWCLARAARLYPREDFAGPARAALARSLTSESIGAEASYLEGEGRAGFERPYGLAWLLQLCAELREWGAGEPSVWRTALAPLEELAARRLDEWTARLAWPVRSGEHAQSAFALGLALDWTRTADERELRGRLAAHAERLYGADRDAPLAYEPSGQDFLSALLGEADLMRRVRDPAAFARWLGDFLPDLTSLAARRWLEPVVSPDRADGKLAHLDGLNLSRAWMLEGICGVLPADEPRWAPLREAAARHRDAGLATVATGHYAGEHWLGSFATYLVTRRGIA